MKIKNIFKDKMRSSLFDSKEPLEEESILWGKGCNMNVHTEVDVGVGVDMGENQIAEIDHIQVNMPRKTSLI
jgi:hypothetical protein